jgi:Uma2 family endonuclease
MRTATAPMTVDEFLTLPDVEEQHVELIQGEVVYMPSGGPVYELVKSNLIGILRDWLRDHPFGRLFVEAAYRLDDHDSVIPDLSLLSADRMQRGIADLLRGAPDLAVEVVSSETAARLRTKIGLYLKNGSQAVWVVFPEARVIEIHSANGQIGKCEQDQVLEDHDALPGFSVPVAQIFAGL